MILKGIGGGQTLVTKGLLRSFYITPFKEIFGLVSKITVMFSKESKLWKS